MGCVKLDCTDTIGISYSSAHNRFDIEVKYEDLLRKMPFLRENICVFKDCFDAVVFSNGYVSFASEVKDMNCKLCSLLWCSDVEKLTPRYKIYPYGKYPDDDEQNCLYHLDGNWYIRLP